MIKSRIGQGAYRNVYETNRQNIVAKEIFNILNGLDHPNIIKPIAVILESDQYYMLLPKLNKIDVLIDSELLELYNAIKYFT